MLNPKQITSIQSAWSRETCYPKDRQNWSQENPSKGQCAVTALLIQDLLGGDILFSQKNNHYWNKVDDVEIDLTREQFRIDIDTSDSTIVSRESLFSSESGQTRIRYELLRNQFNQKK